MFGRSDKKKLEKMLESIEELYVEGDFEGAERELDEAKALAVKLSDNSALVIIQNFLAGIYRGTGRLEQALVAAKDCLALAEKEGEPAERLGYLSDNVAQILERLEREEESITFFEQAIAQLRTAEEVDMRTVISSQQAIARLNLILERPLEAEKALQKSLDMAREGNSIEEQMEVVNTLAEMYLGSDRPREAVTILAETRDSIMKAFKEPKNIYAVIDPQAMAFEMIKEEHKKDGTVPFHFQGLLVQLSRANHKLGTDDGIPGNLPKSSDFEERMYAESPVELANKIEHVGVALHFLAQETGRPLAFRQAEEYYQKAHGLVSEVAANDPAAAEIKASLEDNLQELAEDRVKATGSL